MTSIKLTKKQILVEASRRRLEWFATFIDARYEVTTFHHNYLRVLDYFVQGKVRNLIIQAPCQHGKSSGSSRFLPSMMLGLFPDKKIVLASYSSTIAKDFNRDVQRIIDSEDYHNVFPETLLAESNVVPTKSRAVRTTDIFQIVDHTGEFRVVGRGGSLTSKTADVLIMDDLYKDSAEANSSIIREGAWNWYTKVARTRLHNDSQQLIVFTRWHKDDIIGRLCQEEKVIYAKNWSDLEDVPSDTWVLVNFEAIKTGEPTEIDPRDVGEALWEERHSLARLLAMKQLDPMGFQCLYQGNPESAEGRLYAPFKTYVNKEDYGTLVRKGAYIDVADEGEDFLACATYDIYKSNEQAYNEKKRRFEPILYALITDIVFTQESTDVTSITCPRIINEQGTQKVFCEANNGGSQFGKRLATKVRAIVDNFHQTNNKESRIISNASYVNQSIVFPYGWEERYPMAYKHVTEYLRNFKANVHDDFEDMLTGIYEKEIADGNYLAYGGGTRGIKVR